MRNLNHIALASKKSEGILQKKQNKMQRQNKKMHWYFNSLLKRNMCMLWVYDSILVCNTSYIIIENVLEKSWKMLLEKSGNPIRDKQ